MTDKMLSIQRRKAESEPKPQTTITKKRFRGQVAKSFVPSKNDSFVAMKRREILAPYDRHLRSFNHTKALDVALQAKFCRYTPEVTVSVIQELIRRGHIHTALSGRDESSLLSVLRFIHKNLSSPTFMSTLLDVFNLILDIYGIAELMNSGPLEAMLLKIKELVNTEVRLMTNVQEIMGSMDLLFAVGESQKITSNNTPSLSETVQGVHSQSEPMTGVESEGAEASVAANLEGRSLLHCLGLLASQQSEIHVS